MWNLEARFQGKSGVWREIFIFLYKSHILEENFDILEGKSYPRSSGNLHFLSAWLIGIPPSKKRMESKALMMLNKSVQLFKVLKTLT